MTCGVGVIGGIVCAAIDSFRSKAYGKARHLPRLDMDLNGSFSINDRNLGLEHPAGKTIGDSYAWPGTNYNVLMDLDFSGVIEQDEYDAYQNDPYEAALDAGAISDPDFNDGPWSAAGYDGYIYDDLADLSCVRFRWYDAGLGQWMTRDPIGYADNSNAFSNCIGTPSMMDPSGLSPTFVTFGGIDNLTEYVGLECAAIDPRTPTPAYQFIRSLGTSRGQVVNGRRRPDCRLIAWPYGGQRGANGSSTYVRNFDSEGMLDAEAEAIARAREGGFCHLAEGYRPVRNRMFMIAPKTDTPPSWSECCCSVRTAVYYSPFDGVPNQSIGDSGGYGDPEFWLGMYDNVLVVDTQHITGRIDAGLGAQLIESNECPNHSLGPLLRPLPTMSVMPVWANAEDWRRDGGRTSGAASAIARALTDPQWDYVFVCHSQGCNIARNVVNAMCSPEGTYAGP